MYKIAHLLVLLGINGAGAGGRQILVDSRVGPNPTDRRKGGAKHHLLSDEHDIPLSVILTEANRHDVTQLLLLVDEIPTIGGKRGRPRRKPDLVQGDRGYDPQPLRAKLANRGIDTLSARRNTDHGSGLGVTRWVIESTIAWLHQIKTSAGTLRVPT